MIRIRRLPRWYEEALLYDVSELTSRFGIRVRVMATPPVRVEFFTTCCMGDVGPWTGGLCRTITAAIPEAASEAPVRSWWRKRREFDVWIRYWDVGPTAVCRIAKDGQPELVIAMGSRDPWRALF